MLGHQYLAIAWFPLQELSKKLEFIIYARAYGMKNNFKKELIFNMTLLFFNFWMAGIEGRKKVAEYRFVSSNVKKEAMCKREIF